MIAFWVGGNPATKGSWKVARGKLRPDNLRERPWSHAIGWSAKAAGVKLSTAPIRLVLDFYFAKPKRPVNPFPARNDVDKLARSALDALTGIAWTDDQQVIDLRVTKMWAGDSGPGAYLSIEEVAR